MSLKDHTNYNPSVEYWFLRRSAELFQKDLIKFVELKDQLSKEKYYDLLSRFEEIGEEIQYIVNDKKKTNDN